jgi:hypothetical protein
MSSVIIRLYGTDACEHVERMAPSCLTRRPDSPVKANDGLTFNLARCITFVGVDDLIKVGHCRIVGLDYSPRNLHNWVEKHSTFKNSNNTQGSGLDVAISLSPLVTSKTFSQCHPSPPPTC